MSIKIKKMKSSDKRRKKGLFVLILVLLFCISAALFFVKPAFNYLTGYLSKSEEVKANILLVEGWISEPAIENACNEFKNNDYEYIVTTGLKIHEKYFKLSENGFLIFPTRKIFAGMNRDGQHSIEVDAYSSLDGENSARFNFYINDSLRSDFAASKKRKRYRVTYSGNLSEIDSIAVQFTNDDRGVFGDRNLYIKELIIDDKIIIPYTNSEFDAGKPDGKRRMSNHYDSNAQYVRNRLISMGIDSSKVIATSGNRVKINRTLTSALAFRDWLKTTKIKVTGINILTVGPHARRTWMTYNKILDEKFEIGIISAPDGYRHQSDSAIKFNTLRETIGILYYWLILIPY
jgi:hypothetical protein